MSSDPGTAELSERVAGISVAGPPPPPTGGASNGMGNGASSLGPTTRKALGIQQRPQLSGRKLSLQERGPYQGAGGGRMARPPTIESKRISISGDPQVRGNMLF